jgi:hypothetical protein
LAGDGLDPGERLLDPLARSLARRVAGVAHRPTVDPRAPAGDVLGHVRRGVEPTQSGDEVPRVVGPVGADRDPVPARHVLDQPVGRRAFGHAGRPCQSRPDHQARAVLHEQMAHEAQLGLLARALAEQPRLGISGRSMGVVAPPLAMEVTAGVAATAGRLVALVLGPKALHRGPSAGSQGRPW